MTCLTAAKLCFSVSRSLFVDTASAYIWEDYSLIAVDASSASVHHLWHTLALRKERKKRKNKQTNKQKKKNKARKRKATDQLLQCSSPIFSKHKALLKQTGTVKYGNKNWRKRHTHFPGTDWGNLWLLIFLRKSFTLEYNGVRERKGRRNLSTAPVSWTSSYWR